MLLQPGMLCTVQISTRTIHFLEQCKGNTPPCLIALLCVRCVHWGHEDALLRLPLTHGGQNLKTERGGLALSLEPDLSSSIAAMDTSSR